MITRKLNLIVSILFYLGLSELYAQTVTDIDGNIYKTVKIGEQTWMAENLRVERFNNGLVIPMISDTRSWFNVLNKPAYCWYDNDKIKYWTTYGALYNWNAVETQILCPTGWHVPTDKEWTILTDYLGGEELAAVKLKETGTTHWDSPNQATNESGFTALPGGCRTIISSIGEFCFIGFQGCWWSATYYMPEHAVTRELPSYENKIRNTFEGHNRGASVRCLKDDKMKTPKPIKIGDPGTVSDIDGNVYKTVTINSQTWMEENLRVERFNNGEKIPFEINPRRWKNLTKPAYCWYDNDKIKYRTTYGALYNWYAVKTEKLCPTGWHVPTDDDWKILIDNVGGKSIAGHKLKEAGTTHWIDNNYITTNESGFTALPGGYLNNFSGRGFSGGGFSFIGSYGYWWTSTETPREDSRYSNGISYYMVDIFGKVDDEWKKKEGLSVRCIKDN